MQSLQQSPKTRTGIHKHTRARARGVCASPFPALTTGHKYTPARALSLPFLNTPTHLPTGKHEYAYVATISHRHTRTQKTRTHARTHPIRSILKIAYCPGATASTSFCKVLGVWGSSKPAAEALLRCWVFSSPHCVVVLIALRLQVLRSFLHGH
jgi:hypothetical protein